MLPIDLIRGLVQAQNRVVKYIEGETRCPTCEFANIPPGKVLVTSTSGEIRYCTCEVCYTTFRAIGETKAERLKREAEEQAAFEKEYPATVKSTAKVDKKNLKGNNEGSRTKKRTEARTTKQPSKRVKKEKV